MEKRAKLVFTGSFAHVDLSPLESAYEVVIGPFATRTALLAAVQGCSAIIRKSHDPINAEVCSRSNVLELAQ